MAQVEGAVRIIRTDSLGVVTNLIALAQSQATAPSVFFTTKFFDLSPWAAPDAPTDQLYTVQGILFEMQEADPEFLQILIGTKENANDTEVWNGPYDIVPGQITQLNLKARFFAIQLMEIISTELWQMTAIEFFGQPSGRARR